MPTALIIGGANSVWDDAYRALQLFRPDAVFVINDMIALWPLRVDYVVSLHPDKLEKFINSRRHNGFDLRFQVWAHKKMGKYVDRTTPDWSGSSGLFAVKIAKEEGFNAIVVAGVPIDADANHIVRNEYWKSAITFRNGWNKRASEICDITRSMSGWTRTLLGEPTQNWLLASGAAPPDRTMIEVIEKYLEGERGSSTTMETADGHRVKSTA